MPPDRDATDELPPDLDFDLLKRLTETSGVPGYEDRVRSLVRSELADSVDEIRSDAMGNLIGTVHGKREYGVVVAAHLDEIGFMVRHVTESGFIKVDPLGGFDPRVLKAQRVTVHTEDGDLPGVFGSPPPHTMDEDEAEKRPKVEDAAIDVGLDGERVAERVTPGDLVTMDQRTTPVGETVTGKALDNRASVYAMLEVAHRIRNPTVTVHFAATTQEEVGLRGAHALGVDLDPDLAIALDVTVANDIPGFDEEKHVTRLGDGTAIKLKDSSVITNPKVHRRLRSVAEANDVPFQYEILPAGGTDTAGFQTSAGAKPVGAISIPTRYLHTVTEMVNGGDLMATVDLLEEFLRSETGDHGYML